MTANSLSLICSPLIPISNQFKEDLKKIWELKPLVEDYQPIQKDGFKVDYTDSMSGITWILDISRDSGRILGGRWYSFVKIEP